MKIHLVDWLACEGGERERESSVFVYRNKQTSAKTRWLVREETENFHN